MIEHGNTNKKRYNPAELLAFLKVRHAIIKSVPEYTESSVPLIAHYSALIQNSLKMSFTPKETGTPKFYKSTYSKCVHFLRELSQKGYYEAAHALSDVGFFYGDTDAFYEGLKQARNFKVRHKQHNPNSEFNSDEINLLKESFDNKYKELEANLIQQVIVPNQNLKDPAAHIAVVKGINEALLNLYKGEKPQDRGLYASGWVNVLTSHVQENFLHASPEKVESILSHFTPDDFEKDEVFKFMAKCLLKSPELPFTVTDGRITQIEKLFQKMALLHPMAAFSYALVHVMRPKEGDAVTRRDLTEAHRYFYIATKLGEKYGLSDAFGVRIQLIRSEMKWMTPNDDVSKFKPLSKIFVQSLKMRKSLNQE
ncbi:MAG: hypothetical protein LBU87_05870 [Lactobacillales bacterium]|jgi:hypothetical protein|nr:hypothetical protein [Lactobacillales bacterium]